MKRNMLVVSLLCAATLLLLSACASTTRPVKDSGDLASDMETHASPPGTPIDIDENVYQNGASDDTMPMIEDKLPAHAANEAASQAHGELQLV